MENTVCRTHGTTNVRISEDKTRQKKTGKDKLDMKEDRRRNKGEEKEEMRDEEGMR